jgi:hypothetical protein
MVENAAAGPRVLTRHIGSQLRGLASRPTRQSPAQLPQSDPEETRERLHRAFLFTPNEPDPSGPVRNLLADRRARGSWRRRLESLLQLLKPPDEPLRLFLDVKGFCLPTDPQEVAAHRMVNSNHLIAAFVRDVTSAVPDVAAAAGAEFDKRPVRGALSEAVAPGPRPGPDTVAVRPAPQRRGDGLRRLYVSLTFWARSAVCAVANF